MGNAFVRRCPSHPETPKPRSDWVRFLERDQMYEESDPGRATIRGAAGVQDPQHDDPARDARQLPSGLIPAPGTGDLSSVVLRENLIRLAGDDVSASAIGPWDHDLMVLSDPRDPHRHSSITRLLGGAEGRIQELREASSAVADEDADHDWNQPLRSEVGNERMGWSPP